MNILCILLMFVNTILNKEVLRHVHVIYRHGDRAPEKILTEARSHEITWPYGLGQLTDKGIRQQFALGQWLRRRYKNHVGQQYHHTEIYVRSTDVDRTLMSAQANLAGLYYDPHNQIIPNVNWRPIPVHTVSHSAETFMRPFKCHSFNEKLNVMYQSREYNALFLGFEVTLHAMRRASNNTALQYHDMWHIYDNLFCEKTHNVSSAPWVSDELYYNMTKIYNINWKMLYHNDELARLSGGRLLDEIISQMKQYVEDTNQRSERMRVYSGHDTNLAALLAAIGIGDGKPPGYASCLLIELIQRGSNYSDLAMNWVVKMFYKTSSGGDGVTEMSENKLRGCNSDPCELSDFIKYVEPRRLDEDNYRRLCQTAACDQTSVRLFLIFALFVANWCVSLSL